MANPVLNLPRTDSERRLDVLNYALLAAYIITAVCLYTLLPERIPTHFGAGGQPDDYGSRASFVALPLIAGAMTAVFRILTNFPHKFNYIVKITPENAAYEYRKAIQLMQLVNISFLLLFLFLSVQTARVGLGQATGLGPVIILVFILPLLPLFFYFGKRK